MTIICLRKLLPKRDRVFCVKVVINEYGVGKMVQLNKVV